MDNALNRQLFREFFEGRASPMQKALMEKWLREEANQELYFRWLEEWEREHPQFLADTDQAYCRSLERLAQPRFPAPLDEPAREGMRMTSRRFLGWAAATILLALGVMGWLSKDFLLYQQYETAFGQVKRLTLADGSHVVLNDNSLLKVPRFRFGTHTREVWLVGEAEFKVVHTYDHRRFVVRTPDQLEVEVLGTEFVVFSREQGSRVTLHQGRVQLRTLKQPNQQPVLVLPGDVVTISTQGEVTHYHQQAGAESPARKDYQFVFHNTSLEEIKQQVSAQFGVTLQWTDPALSSRTVGGTFRVSRVEELLEVLAEMLNVHLHQADAHTYMLVTPEKNNH